ncbi:hypothetical protein [uncultured Tateyamaria sp.]|uniref:hypothetical protein n=1 Tax=uncultured Tateyamaria sp. TaxID=455651 RepID=UPI00260E3E25|nr:hypothetical protein [uncultured Tateyamaria sp.]
MTHDQINSDAPKKSFVHMLVSSLWWVIESQWWVVREHTDGLQKCKKAGSPTASAILIWAPVICFPQWLIAPMFGFQLETLAIFGARIGAMCIVRKLDGIIPLTRALGLCHLLTFSPVLVLLLMSGNFPYAESTFLNWFVWSQIFVISACLFMDARDFLFHLGGHPYPNAQHVSQLFWIGPIDIYDVVFSAI